MRFIRKIFNNNIVSAVGKDGEEVIVVGAGVGFSTSRGKPVDEERVEREFHLTGLSRDGTFRVLLEIPYTVLRAVSKVAAHLRTEHGVVLTPNVEVALGDHVAQTISRLDSDLPIYNSMLWETKMTYPTEFAIALEVLDILHSELGRKFPLDEAGFVTLHLVNSGLVGDRQEAMTLGAALHEVLWIVEDEMGAGLTESSASTTRLLTHVKFVIQRITRNKLYDGSFNDALQDLKTENPGAYKCATRIGDYLDETFAARITEEERLYLMLHLLKLQDEIKTL